MHREPHYSSPNDLIYAHHCKAPISLFRGRRSNGQADKLHCIHVYRSQQQRALKVSVFDKHSSNHTAVILLQGSHRVQLENRLGHWIWTTQKHDEVIHCRLLLKYKSIPNLKSYSLLTYMTLTWPKLRLFLMVFYCWLLKTCKSLLSALWNPCRGSMICIDHARIQS